MLSVTLNHIKSKVSWEDYVAIAMIFLLLANIMLCPNLEVNTDWYFIFNRVTQIRDCLRDGNIPFFFYNDFLGAGYGTTFFYGYLPLYLFIPCVDLGYKSFVAIYMLVCLTLIYLGVVYFSSRFTNNAKLIGLLYIGSMYAIYYYTASGTGANHLAFGISLFFLGKCVDFFRDKKDFHSASILFWLILNTHLITALLSFLACVLIMLFYLDLSRFKEYIRFAVFTCLICSYFICNFLYHLQGLELDTSSINANIIEQHSADYTIGNNCYLAFNLVGGSLFQMFCGFCNITLGTGLRLLGVGVSFVSLIFLVKRLRLLSKKEIFSLILILVGFVAGIRELWLIWDKYILVPFQFPTRYVTYFLVIFLILCFKEDLSSKNIKLFLLSCCFIDLLLAPLFIQDISEDTYAREPHYTQAMNGEYLDKCFVWNMNGFDYNATHIVDSNGKDDYEFTRNGNQLTVYVDVDEKITLTFPKLYYKGYKCNTSGGSLECKKGYSQFISVDVENYRGYLTLYYQHPFFLKLLDLMTLAVVMYRCLRDVRRYLS